MKIVQLSHAQGRTRGLRQPPACRCDIRPGRHRDERRVLHRMLVNAYHSLFCQISAPWRSCRESLLFAIFSRFSTMLSKAWGNDSQRE
jgi:hypothetical protein